MRADPNTIDVAPAGVAPSNVEFFFECEEDGFSSGWLSFPAGPPYIYTVPIGQPSTVVKFRVKARDTSDNRNETAFSDWFPAYLRSPP